MVVSLRKDFLHHEGQQNVKVNSLKSKESSVEPDLVEVVEMHNWEADRHDGLTSQTNLGIQCTIKRLLDQ